PVDQAAGAAYTVNWGDGSAPESIARAPGNMAGITVSHIYDNAGTYTVQVVATDKNGAAGAPLTWQVTSAVAPRQGNTPVVGGTPGKARLAAYPAKGSSPARVVVNGQSISAAGASEVLIYGYAGKDKVRVVGGHFASIDRSGSQGPVYRWIPPIKKKGHARIRM